jgi:phage shock protein PspC (stress-responsive transcriptional regulator)
MRKVTTINLNNNAYQIDEDGFEALRAYLESAERALVENPDRAEILSDLEQAIADKCRLALGPHKTVVSTAEIERILKEMGPVAGSTAETASTSGGATSGTPGGSATGGPQVRRLYRIREGEKWAGVCNGLAAFAGIDVTWVRVGFVLLTLFAAGFGFVAYLVLLFVMPIATSTEELAAAHGQPFNAQELVDRVKKKHEDLRHERRSRRWMKHQSRWWSPPTAPQPAPGYAARVTGGVLVPVLTVMSAAWFAAMALLMLTVWWSFDHGGYGLWWHGNWAEVPHMPRWLLVAAMIAVYAVIALPIGAARRASLYYANGGSAYGWANGWSGLLWIALVTVAIIAAWQWLPNFQDMLDSIGNGHRHQVLHL